MDTSGDGVVTDRQLKECLFRNNIIIEDKHFQQLLYKVDADGDGSISYGEFLKYFGKGGAADRNVNSTVENVSPDEAIVMIRQKIEQRLASGPGGLRRAFQFFDSDGSGSISHAEFRNELRTRCGLEFTHELLGKVMARFDDDGQGVDYRKFVQLVMGSKATDSTSFGDTSVASMAQGGDAAGTSTQFLKRKIREQWKSLGMAFRNTDRKQSGYVSEEELLSILRNHQVDFVADRKIEMLCVSPCRSPALPPAPCEILHMCAVCVLQGRVT
jgi:Ca2+-binding EF-hand superfamily protein